MEELSEDELKLKLNNITAMADECGNWLTITEISNDELDQMKQFLRSDKHKMYNGEFDAIDFEKVRPIPELVSQTESEWIKKNWGAGYWGSPDGEWITTNCLNFLTKNNPPYPLIAYLSTLYPYAKFELRYASDAELEGVSIFKNGEETYYDFQYTDLFTREVIHRSSDSTIKQ